MWKCFRIFVMLIWGKYVGAEKSSVKRALKVEISPHCSNNKKIKKILGNLKNFSYLWFKFETYRWWKILGIQTQTFFKLLKHITHSRFVLHSVTTAAYGRQINYESRIKWIVRFTQSAVSSSDGVWVGKWDIILALYVRVTL